MAETKTPRINQTRWSSGQDTVKREDFDSDAASLEANVAVYKEGILAERPSAGVVGRFFTVKGDGNPENNGKQFYDNGSEWKAVSYTNNQLAESIGAGDTALTVRAQTSPTADIFKVAKSDGSPLFRVGADGYSSNQASVGVTGGARLGADSSHANAGLFVSVAPGKPVLVVKGANGQTANPIEVRNNNDVTLSFLDRSGGATFTGTVTAAGLNSSGPITAPSINVTSSASFLDTVVSAGASNHVALTVNSFDSAQSVNLMEFYSPQHTRTARVLSDGTIASNGRLFLGANEGDSGVQNYANSTAVVTVKNGINATTPVLSLLANDVGQTGKMMQVTNSQGLIRFWVDSSGAFYSGANANVSTISVGSGNAGATTYYNSYTPRAEILTGTGSGAYNESIAIRHSGTSSTAAIRRVGIQLKMSGEASQAETNRWAGIYAQSTDANANNPSLEFWTNGTVAGVFAADNSFQMNGDARLAANKTLTFGSSSSNKLFLTDVPDNNVIGYQSGGTVFVRSDNFAIYSGGTYNSTSLNSGGGTAMATFTPARATVKRLTIATASTYNSTEPSLQIGTTSHMQFSPYSINSYDDVNNNVPAEVNIANNGGRVRLGNTASVVSLPSRIMWVGNIDDQQAANAVLFARSSAGNFNYWVGRAAQNGDVWFDHTSNRIGIHDGAKWQIFMPDHSSAVGITG